MGLLNTYFAANHDFSTSENQWQHLLRTDTTKLVATLRQGSHLERTALHAKRQ